MSANVHSARKYVTTVKGHSNDFFSSASFHPLTNRKHHCRLCGKIICSLPSKMPQRPQTCSLLFFMDSKTKKIEEVGEGVDYGVRRKNRNGAENEDKFLRAVRICRTCRPVLMCEHLIFLECAFSLKYRL